MHADYFDIKFNSAAVGGSCAPINPRVQEVVLLSWWGNIEICVFLPATQTFLQEFEMCIWNDFIPVVHPFVKLHSSLNYLASFTKPGV